MTEGESGTGFWCIWGTSFRGCLGFFIWATLTQQPCLGAEGVILLKLSPGIRSLGLLQSGAGGR